MFQFHKNEVYYFQENQLYHNKFNDNKFLQYCHSLRAKIYHGVRNSRHTRFRLNTQLLTNARRTTKYVKTVIRRRGTTNRGTPNFRFLCHTVLHGTSSVKRLYRLQTFTRRRPCNLPYLRRDIHTQLLLSSLTHQNNVTMFLNSMRRVRTNVFPIILRLHMIRTGGIQRGILQRRRLTTNQFQLHDQHNEPISILTRRTPRHRRGRSKRRSRSTHRRHFWTRRVLLTFQLLQNYTRQDLQLRNTNRLNNMFLKEGNLVRLQRNLSTLRKPRTRTRLRRLQSMRQRTTIRQFYT